MRQSGFMRARTRGANGRRGGKGRGFSGAVLTGGKRAFRLFPVLLAAVAFAAPVAAGDSPQVEWRVVDGDTIARGDERVRFCAVDTPERGKPGAAAATGAMRGLLRGAGGAVRVEDVGSTGSGGLSGGFSSAKWTRRFSCWPRGWRAFTPALRTLAPRRDCPPRSCGPPPIRTRRPGTPEGDDGKARKTGIMPLAPKSRAAREKIIRR